MTIKQYKNILWTVSFGLILLTLFLVAQTQSANSNIAAVPAYEPVQQVQKIEPEVIKEAPTPETPDVNIEQTATTEPAPEVEPATADPEPVVEDEGSPEGYVGFPPQCDSLWWNSLPGENPIRFTAKLNPYQTSVTINGYDFYVNDTLVQSSGSNTISYEATATGQLTFHVIIRTSLGDTLRSTLCEQTLDIDSSYFL